MVEKPTEQELSRHLLLLITSLLHEIQHIATYAFLNPSPDKLEACDEEAADSGGCKSLPPSSTRHQHRATPQHIGTTNIGGRVTGDSGFEWEDTVFGGRLVHLEQRDMPCYFVSFFK